MEEGARFIGKEGVEPQEVPGIQGGAHQEQCQPGDGAFATHIPFGEENQNLLRGYLAIGTNPDCPDCPTGIDLSHADFTIELFAQTIKANCVQTGQIISNHTGQPPGSVSIYEDLWRYTLVNYHAGPGCLSDSVKELKKSNQPINWGNIAAKLNIICPGAVEYVDKVAKE